MRIHAYAAGGGGAQTRTVVPEARLGEVVLVEVDERVYLVDDDTDTELDLDASLAQLFGDEPGHVVVHSCRRIAVAVTYAGVEKVVEVHPAVRLRRVRVKAIEEFRISPADAADLVLRLPGSDQDLDLTEPVGAIVSKGTCGVAVDLVHTVRPQG